MVFDPTENPLLEDATTVNEPEPEPSVTVPSVVLPSVNSTVPVTVPLMFDVTFAVKTTELPSATDGGLALTVVVVDAPPAEAETLTVVEALELLKFESPE